MSAVSIRPGVLRDVSYVMAHLRPADEHEVFCQLPDNTKRHDIALSFLMGGNTWTAHYRGQPVAAFGVSILNVAAVSVWALGTKHMTRVMPAITRHYRDVVGPDLIATGCTVMEARSIVGHTAAHRWMASTGAVSSGVPYPYGKKGEQFLTFRWTAEDFMRNR